MPQVHGAVTEVRAGPGAGTYLTGAVTTLQQGSHSSVLEIQKITWSAVPASGYFKLRSTGADYVYYPGDSGPGGHFGGGTSGDIAWDANEAAIVLAIQESFGIAYPMNAPQVNVTKDGSGNLTITLPGYSGPGNPAGYNWDQITVISNLLDTSSDIPLGEIQRVTWDAVPGKGLYYFQGAFDSNGIAWNADDSAIASALNEILGTGAVKVTQIVGKSFDIIWLKSLADQPALVINTDLLFTADATTSTGGGTGGTGPGTTDTLMPVIQPITDATTYVGATFARTFPVLNDPDSWSATGVPPGLTFDTTTGELSGDPTLPGDFIINLRATNSHGTSDPVAFKLAVLPTAAGVGGRRILLDLSRRIIAYADTLEIADPLNVSLKDGAFTFESKNGFILPGGSPGRLEFKATVMLTSSANSEASFDSGPYVINAGVDVTTPQPGWTQLINVGEDWSGSTLLALFNAEQTKIVLIGQLRWRNGDDPSGHFQRSALFKINVSNTLFWA